MGAPNVLVVFANGFEEIEALVPVDLLRRAGAHVVTAGVGSKEIVGSHDIHLVCDIQIDDTVAEYDCMICPGGMPGALNLAQSWDVMKQLAHVADKGLVCAICAAPAVVLGMAGMLEGHKAVCYPGQEAACPSVEFGKDRVMVDGNIITARGAGCAIEFSLAIIERLFDKETATRIADAIIWK